MEIIHITMVQVVNHLCVCEEEELDLGLDFLKLAKK